MPTTMLIVDDHEHFRRSASALLEAEGFVIVGEAGDGAAGIAAADRLRPEIVLLDVQLPDIDGIAVAERLAELSDPPHVVLMSSHQAATYGSRLAGAPIRGFIAKRELSGAALAVLVS